MKIELGQFYLGSDNTVFVFNRKTRSGGVQGTAFQGGRAFSVGLDLDIAEETKYTFIPIDPAIAKIIQSGQAIDTSVV